MWRLGAHVDGRLPGDQPSGGGVDGLSSVVVVHLRAICWSVCLALGRGRSCQPGSVRAPQRPLPRPPELQRAREAAPVRTPLRLRHRDAAPRSRARRRRLSSSRWPPARAPRRVRVRRRPRKRASAACTWLSWTSSTCSCRTRMRARTSMDRVNRVKHDKSRAAPNASDTHPAGHTTAAAQHHRPCPTDCGHDQITSEPSSAPPPSGASHAAGCGAGAPSGGAADVVVSGTGCLHVHQHGAAPWQLMLKARQNPGHERVRVAALTRRARARQPRRRAWPGRPGRRAWARHHRWATAPGQTARRQWWLRGGT